MRHLTFYSALATAVVTGALAGQANAWLSGGHNKATALAVDAAGTELPAFFAAGKETIAKSSVQPDLFTRPVATQPLHAAESSDHYFDLELVPSWDADKATLAKPMPATREQFVEMLAKSDRRAGSVGLLPYAIVEHCQRLTVLLAQHRRWPADKAIQQQCLVEAGRLAHYAQDATQPLHTTVHFDGRLGENGKSPRSGIHIKVDALIQKVDVKAGDLVVLAPPVDPAAVVERLAETHELVARVYELEAELPAAEAETIVDEAVTQFARQRLGAAAELTAGLYVRAWQDSAAVEMPDWKDLNGVFGAPATQSAATQPAAPASQPFSRPYFRRMDTEPGAVRKPLPPPGPPAVDEQGNGEVNYEADGIKVHSSWTGPSGTASVTTMPGGGVKVEVRSSGSAKSSARSSSGQ